MTCAHLEIALCDYLDGTLSSAEKAEVERHLSGCAACAEMARDAGGILRREAAAHQAEFAIKRGR